LLGLGTTKRRFGQTSVQNVFWTP